MRLSRMWLVLQTPAENPPPAAVLLRVAAQRKSPTGHRRGATATKPQRNNAAGSHRGGNTSMVLYFQRESGVSFSLNILSLWLSRWCRRTWSQRRWGRTPRMGRAWPLCVSRLSESAGGTAFYWQECYRLMGRCLNPDAPVMLADRRGFYTTLKMFQTSIYFRFLKIHQKIDLCFDIFMFFGLPTNK